MTKFFNIKKRSSATTRAKKNFFKSFHIAIGTGAIFGSIAISIAVPITLQYGGIKEIETEDLRIKFPELKNFLGLTPELAERELKSAYQIDKIEGFQSFRKRRRRTASIPYYSSKTEEITVYLYQKPHIDNKIFYIETSKKRIPNTDKYEKERIDLAFLFDGIDIVDLANTIKLGRNLHLDAVDDASRSSHDGLQTNEPYKELFRNMREMAIRSMRTISQALNLDLDDHNDPIPSQFEEENFKTKLKAKVVEERQYAIEHGESFTNITERDVFDDVYLHNDIIQEENIGYLRKLIEAIKEQSIEKIILENNDQNFIHAFNDPVFWSEAISNVVVNKNGQFNVIQDLVSLRKFAMKYGPLDTFETSENAWVSVIDQTIDKLIEVMQEQHQTALLKRFGIPENVESHRNKNEIKTIETLKKVINLTEWVRKQSDQTIKQAWALWKPIDLEVILNKSDTYLKTIIFRSIDRRHHDSFIAKTSYNPKFGIKSFSGMTEYKFERTTKEVSEGYESSYEKAFNSIILTAEEDVKLTSPELAYIYNFGKGYVNYNNDIKHYDGMVEWIENWFNKYNAYETATVGRFTDNNFLIGDANNNRSWVKEGLLELLYDICNKAIVTGKKVNYRENINNLNTFLEKENLMPPTNPNDKTNFDPRENNYILMKELAMSLSKAGFDVDHKKIEDFIFKKRRRRRR